MSKEIEFQGLKFKTSFNFKNAKARAKYFEGLLIESIDKFREKQKDYFAEKLHVLLTYLTLFKLFAYTDLFWAILFPGTRLAFAIIAVVMFIIHLILNKKFNRNIFRYEFTVAMNDNPEFIEFLREDTIEHSRNIKL